MKAIDELIHDGKWRPIEEAPKDTTGVLGYHRHKGVFICMYGCLADMLPEIEVEASHLGEDTLWSQDWWTCGMSGLERLENDDKPTQFRADPPDNRLADALEVAVNALKKHDCDAWTGDTLAKIKQIAKEVE